MAIDSEKDTMVPELGGERTGLTSPSENRDERIERKVLFVVYFFFWFLIALVVSIDFFAFRSRSAATAYGSASSLFELLFLCMLGIAVCFLRPPLRRWAIGLHTLLFLAWGLLF